MKRSISSASRISPASVASSSASRSEEHTSELQSRQYLVCRLLLEKNKHSVRHVHPLARLVEVHALAASPRIANCIDRPHRHLGLHVVEHGRVVDPYSINLPAYART